MKRVKDLLDQAVATCQSEAELARRIGLHYQQINDMRKGRRVVSPETVAALCEVLELPGEEAREWLAVSIIENPKNAKKAGVLRRCFFAVWALGVAVSLTTWPASEARSEAIDLGIHSGKLSEWFSRIAVILRRGLTTLFGVAATPNSLRSPVTPTVSAAIPAACY